MHNARPVLVDGAGFVLAMGAPQGSNISFFFFLFSSSSPKALHMVSLTNPLRSFKRTDLSLSRIMAVSRGILISC
jgi:hypothetical protein